MVFEIDESRYRVIDLSLRIEPPGPEGRPFQVERDRWPDESFLYRITTHTHVGTHIESPAHFFEGGRRLEDFPLNRFYGPAVLFEFAGIDGEPVTGAAFQADIGPLMRENRIVVCRNSHPDWRRVAREQPERLPYLSPDGAQWLADHKANLLVIHDFTGIQISDCKETSQRNHAILLASGVEVLPLEFATGLEQITKKEFFFMALPIRFAGVDSMWARAVAIEER